jgi:hypothetical protein
VRLANRLIPLAFLLVTSCEYEASVVPAPNPPRTATAASAFDPADCGTITGRVTWDGETPVAAPFIYGVPNPDGNFTVHQIPNPNLPEINETSRAIAGAVVFLKRVDPAKAKPWHHEPVRIEMKNRGIFILQGEASGRVGFVCCGGSVTMVSAEPAYHVLRARGAAFFSLAFPDANQPLTRIFDKPGRVELSSGAGYYWASANLFVAEHPYYAVTDRDGRFTLEQVPAGSFEVTAWLPNWEVVQRERDPETGLYCRQTYGPPLERSQLINVKPQATAAASFVFSNHHQPAYPK